MTDEKKMNVAKALELVFVELLRAGADDGTNLGENVYIRAWQSADADGSQTETGDRYFPMVDVRCAPHKTDQSQATLSVETSFLCMTKDDADKTHARISELYEAVQAVVDQLFSEFRNIAGATALPLYDKFISRMAELVPDGKFEFGGFVFGEPLAPRTDGGLNMIGITLVVSYSRSDF